MENREKDIIEEIGKIKLNLKHYPGEDFYCDGDIEDELLEITKNYAQAEYPRIIEERKSWEILYHLSAQRENIVEWLPIDKSMKVLEVGSGCGAITGALAKKAGAVTCIDLSKKRSMINAYRHMDCKNVTIHVGNFQDIEPDLECDYDYICLIGVFEYGQAYIDSAHPYEDFLRIVERHRKKDGHIAIAIENKFGLKYWAGCKEDHLGTWFSGLEDYPEGGVVRTFTRDGLLKIARECGFAEVSMYYPYPDYKFMTSLYSDERLPKPGELSSNLRNFDRERLQLFDEKLVFDTIIKEGQFPLFSNSYMMILGPEQAVKYAKYSNDRADAYQIKTLLTHQDTNGKNGEITKQIEKHPLSKSAQEHVLQMYQSYEKISERFAGSKLQINNCCLVKKLNNKQEKISGRVSEEIQESIRKSIQEDVQADSGNYVYAAFEYLEGRTLEELLDECLEKDDLERFHLLFDEYLEKTAYHEEARITDYDLIFSNILISQDGQWHIIDYEWTFEKQVETKEIAFRAVYCYLLENERRNKLNLDLIMKKLDISETDAAQYRQQEMKFQKYVTGKRMSMAEIRNAIGQPVYTLQDLSMASPSEKQKDKIQIYEDMGNGFSEENSFFVEGSYLEEMSSSEELILKEKSSSEELTRRGKRTSEEVSPAENGFCVTIEEGRKALRIDPCSDYCIVWIKEIKWNDTVISTKSRKLSTNGSKVGDSTYAFATEDPNITLQLSELEQKQENLLQVSMQVTRMPKETVNHMQKRGLF